MARSHDGNFRDPVGLLRRMATSRERAAWDALALAASTTVRLGEDDRAIVDAEIG